VTRAPTLFRRVAADVRWQQGAALVILSGAVLRLATCATYVFNDEYPIVGNVLTFFRDRTLVPSHFAYPTFFSYLIALPTVIGAAALNVSGILPSVGDIGALLNVDSVLAVLPARLTSCTFGILTLLVVFETGRRFYSERVALVAVVLLSFSSLHITYSAYALPDVTMTFFALCSLRFSIAALRTRQKRDVLLASAFAGLTAATKYNGALVLLPVIAVHLLHLSDDRRLTVRHVVFDVPWVSIGLVFVAAFLIGSPAWLLRPAAFHDAVAYEAVHMRTGHPGFFGVPYLQQIALLWQWERTFAALILSSLVYAAYKRTPQDLLLFALIVPAFAIIGSWGKQDLHYLLFLYPAFSLLVGRFVVDAVAACPAGRRRLALVCGIAATAVLPLYDSVGAAYKQLRVDSRWITAEWIQNNVAEGEAIVLEDEHSHLSRFFTVQEKQQLMAGDHQKFYQRHLGGTRAYRLIPLEYDPDWVSGIQATYLLVGSDTFQRYFSTPPPPAGSSLFQPFMDRRETYRTIFDGRSAWILSKIFDRGKGPRVLLYRHR
jgi:dolichyl-phosphate-mannose-protein mannosyltransferase